MGAKTAIHSFSELHGAAEASEEAEVPMTPPKAVAGKKGKVNLHAAAQPELPEGAIPEVMVSLVTTVTVGGERLVLQPGQVVPVWDLSTRTQLSTVQVEAVVGVYHEGRLVGHSAEATLTDAELDMLADAVEAPGYLTGEVQKALDARMGSCGGAFRLVLPRQPLGMFCAASAPSMTGSAEWRRSDIAPVTAHRRFRNAAERPWSDSRPCFFVSADGGMPLRNVAQRITKKGSKNVLVEVDTFPMLPLSLEPAEVLAKEVTGARKPEDVMHAVSELTRRINVQVEEYRRRRGRGDQTIWFGYDAAEATNDLVPEADFWAGRAGRVIRKARLPLTDLVHGLRPMFPTAVAQLRAIHAGETANLEGLRVRGTNGVQVDDSAFAA